MKKSIFADDDSTANLQSSVDLAIQRIKTITTAFSSDILAKAQYEKAVKSLNFAISQLDDAQCMVEDSIHGSVAYNDVVEDGSIGSLLMSNIAISRMSAQLCLSAMMSDLGEDMSLDDALDIGDDADEPNIDDDAENQDIDGDEPVKDVKEQVKKESSNKSDGNTEDTGVEVTNIGSSEGEKVENKDPDVDSEDEDEECVTLEELNGSKDEDSDENGDQNKEGAATTKHSNQTIQEGFKLSRD